MYEADKFSGTFILLHSFRPRKNPLLTPSPMPMPMPRPPSSVPPVTTIPHPPFTIHLPPPNTPTEIRSTRTDGCLSRYLGAVMEVEWMTILDKEYGGCLKEGDEVGGGGECEGRRKLGVRKRKKSTVPLHEVTQDACQRNKTLLPLPFLLPFPN